MGAKGYTHHVELCIVRAAFTEHETGTEIKILVQLACAKFCDLRGKTIKLAGPDNVCKEHAITGFNGVENSTDAIFVQTGAAPGEYKWTALFSDEDEEGNSHEENSASFTYSYKPHAISLAVWDIPVTAQVNSSFKISVGIKCSAQCNLKDSELELIDHNGEKMATAGVMDTTFAGTNALYWASLDLLAPSVQGIYTWQVKYNGHEAHAQAYTQFNFKVSDPAEFTVTVTVMDKEQNAPVEDATVMLHPFKQKTDENGIASFTVAKGEYPIFVTGLKKYDPFKGIVLINDDTAFQALLATHVEMIEDF